MSNIFPWLNKPGVIGASWQPRSEIKPPIQPKPNVSPAKRPAQRVECARDMCKENQLQRGCGIRFGLLRKQIEGGKFGLWIGKRFTDEDGVSHSQTLFLVLRNAPIGWNKEGCTPTLCMRVLDESRTEVVLKNPEYDSEVAGETATLYAEKVLKTVHQ